MKRNQGFTLIELLIVITIIGILAVTGMSLLNPVEMIKRTQDGTAKTTARQVLDATVQAYLNDRTAYCNTCGTNIGVCANVRPSSVCSSLTSGLPKDISIADTTTTPQVAALGTTRRPFNILVDHLVITGLVKSTAQKSDLYKAPLAGDNGYDVRVGFNYGTDSYEICFKPLSKAGQKEAGTVEAGNCSTTGAVVGTTGQCLMCIQ